MFVGSSLMGSLAKAFLAKHFVEVLWKIGENLQKCVLLHQERVRNFCGKLRKFRRSFQTNFCNDPFLNDIISELLSSCSGVAIIGAIYRTAFSKFVKFSFRVLLKPF